MSHSDKDFVPEKVQESLFKALLQRPENHQCADCQNKSPTWASIEFGVFLCIGCSGIHRQLGPHITRVKSSKLDKWKRDQVEIMTSVGNKLANDYYEFKLPKGFRRLDSTASPEEFARFVKDKYIKKSFAPPGYPTPVAEFLTNKQKGLVVDLSFAKQGFIASQQQKDAIPVVRKKSLTLEHGPNEPAKKEVPVQKVTINKPQPQAATQAASLDFLTDNNDAPTSQPTSATATQKVNSNEPTKPSSAFEFDFSAIQQPSTQNQNQNQTQTQQQPQTQVQVQGQTQGQNQFQAQQQAANMPQQAQPDNSVPDIKKLYQQSNNMYNNQYAMNPMMMMGNNGFNPYGNNVPNAMYQNQMYQQNNQGWNQGQGQFNNGGMGMNMNMNNYGQFPVNNGMQQQQMYQNNFNQNVMANNMYAQQQQQQMNYNMQMQNNGFNQGMNYAQNSPTKFF